jgi:hypothetical protein
LNQKVFTVACAVVQKVCARNHHTDVVVKRGIASFYKYIVCNILENKETFIVDYLLKHNCLVKKHDIDSVFSDPLDKQCFLILFSKHHPHLERPKIILSLPWINALSLVSSRRAFLYGGIAYFSYADAPEIAFDAWSLCVQEWKKWDLDNIFVPSAISRERQIITSTTTEREANKIRSEIALDVMKTMTRSNYTSDENQIVEQMCSTVALTYVKAPVAKTNITIAHQNTGDFFIDFGNCMPPCIAGIITGHFAKSTHMVYSERYIVFSWAYRANVPLSTLETFWSEMLTKDKSVDTAKRASLMKDLSNIYSSLEKKLESGMQLALKSCANMQQYCPYSSNDLTDIEDMVSNSILKCKSACGGTQFKHWSLMAATIARSNKRE